MKRTNRTTLLIITLVLLSGTAALHAGQVQVFAAAEKEIYVAEPFQYQIIIDGAEEAGQVDIAPLQSWSPSYLGGRNQSGKSITIINNRKTVQEQKKYIMAYQLRANQAGQAILPAVTVKINGRSFRTNPVQIDVLKPATTEKLALKMELSSTDCYVGQPIIMTICWDIGVRVRDFNFNIPALRDTENFFVEDTDTPPGSSGELVRIDLEDGVAIARKKRDGNNSLKVTFSKILIPRRAGTIRIAPPSVSCQVEVGRNRGRNEPWGGFFSDDVFGRSVYKRFSCHAQEAILNVRPLPREGRPDNFNDLVGRYSISATALPEKVNIGDPITLTISIAGELLKNVAMPDLQAIPEMAKNFKITTQRSAPKITDGCKEFTQTIRAANDRVTQIPAIPLSYFDVETGQYVTVFSRPVPLEVSPTRMVTAQQAEGWNMKTPTSEIEAVHRGIAANIYDQSKLLRNSASAPTAALVQPVHIAIWACPAILLVVSGVVRLIGRNSPARNRARRRAGACRKALVQLTQLKDQADPDPKETAEILRQYVGERFDKTIQSLTARDCGDILLENCPERDLAQRFCELLEQCEHHRFAGAQPDRDKIDIRRMSKLIKTLDKSMRNKKTR